MIIIIIIAHGECVQVMLCMNVDARTCIPTDVCCIRFTHARVSDTGDDVHANLLQDVWNVELQNLNH